MKYDFYLENCGDDDVISFSEQMTKISKFKQALDTSKQNMIDYFVNSLESQGVKGVQIYERGQSANYKLYSEGKDCEILKIGSKGWQKGKFRVKVSIEFEPEEPETNEPESPLDDLRQKMNENSK